MKNRWVRENPKFISRSCLLILNRAGARPGEAAIRILMSTALYTSNYEARCDLASYSRQPESASIKPLIKSDADQVFCQGPDVRDASIRVNFLLCYYTNNFRQRFYDPEILTEFLFSIGIFKKTEFDN